MEMLALPNIKTHGNGQNGKKGCRQKKGMSGKLADIDVLARHVADTSPTFPTKVGDGQTSPSSLALGILQEEDVLGDVRCTLVDWLI